MKHHTIRILYIQHVSFGDVLVSTAIISKLKEKYPESTIDYYTTEACAPLLYKNPDINNIYVERYPPADANSYDITFRPYRCLQASGGWHLNGRHFMDLYAEICGVKLSGNYILPYHNVEPDETPLKGTKYILIQCKTNDSAKDYDRFEELVEKLKPLKFPIIQIGGPNDHPICGTYGFVSSSWAKVAGLIKGAVTTICLDSAAQHLTGALKMSYIALYGPKEAKMVRSGVVAMGSTVVGTGKHQYALEPENRNDCRVACNLASCMNPKGKCINNIEPETIVNLVDRTVQDVND